MAEEARRGKGVDLLERGPVVVDGLTRYAHERGQMDRLAGLVVLPAWRPEPHPDHDAADREAMDADLGRTGFDHFGEADDGAIERGDRPLGVGAGRDQDLQFDDPVGVGIDDGVADLELTMVWPTISLLGTVMRSPSSPVRIVAPSLISSTTPLTLLTVMMFPTANGRVRMSDRPAPKLKSGPWIAKVAPNAVVPACLSADGAERGVKL